MRFMGLVGLYQKGASTDSIASGIIYTTQPGDLPLGALAVDDAGARVYEFVKVSGTPKIGEMVYYTGATKTICSPGQASAKPCGVTLYSGLTNGSFTWIQRQGRCPSILASAALSASAGNIGIFVFDGASSVVNLSGAVSGTLIGTGGTKVAYQVGHAISSIAAGATGLGYVDLL
jgi:hypothetical protein